MFIAVVKWDAENRVIKHWEFDNEQDVNDFITDLDPEKFPDAFGDVAPQGGRRDWLVDLVTKTLSYDPIPEPAGPTNGEIYDDVLQNQKVLKAIALVCAEQFGMTPAQMKTAVKSKM